MKKEVLLIIIGILLVLIITLFLGIKDTLMNTKIDFIKYLNQQYPSQTFEVEDPYITYDFVNSEGIMLISKVVCAKDNVPFFIAKSLNSQRIVEHYVDRKSEVQYNSQIKDIFGRSEIRNVIKDVSGNSQGVFDKGSPYEQISIHLTDAADIVSTTSKALFILKENKIYAKVFIYGEKENQKYVLLLSSDDYGLSNNEIKDKITFTKDLR